MDVCILVCVRLAAVRDGRSSRKRIYKTRIFFENILLREAKVRFRSVPAAGPSGAGLGGAGRASVLGTYCAVTAGDISINKY